jgi:hypothetical protein
LRESSLEINYCALAPVICRTGNKMILTIENKSVLQSRLTIRTFFYEAGDQWFAPHGTAKDAAEFLADLVQKGPKSVGTS